jgi:ABC-type Fe3+-siderophore transport system permease subunit
MLELVILCMLCASFVWIIATLVSWSQNDWKITPDMLILLGVAALLVFLSGVRLPFPFVEPNRAIASVLALAFGGALLLRFGR